MTHFSSSTFVVVIPISANVCGPGAFGAPNPASAGPGGAPAGPFGTAPAPPGPPGPAAALAPLRIGGLPAAREGDLESALGVTNEPLEEEAELDPGSTSVYRFAPGKACCC